MPMRLGSPLPPLDGATEWFNAQGFDPAQLQNHPVLVHFWAVSCHICHEVMPEVVAYRDTYKPYGLQFVGVHMPKQESDTDLEKVKQDIAEYGITQPVAVDNLHQVTDQFQNQFVPAFFLFDKEGKLFFRAAGDKGFQNLKPKIESLLGIKQS
ncbi:TlpA family protein disulfide reductase [Effusibacillus dendaii]|uniref:Thiol-disulfide oxidoreductase YkuV n=1 Tax=Effusibacillus dendaii TaxID=2743772 RepID=A0A7I8DIU5_9BACL|nr:TlpA disulfide reductase family protein [Effusibacillus dendaii]BCJ88580.1 thiol-disulfide oxidoreductase YkuV [Effusibacillus dendaii]